MRHINPFESFNNTRKKTRKMHNLSGIILIVEDRILLVHAKKYLTEDNKWSIPKGHIEGDSLESALKELEEETGIILDKNYNSKFSINYKKTGIYKLMDVFVYNCTKDKVQKYLNKWSISKDFFIPTEIISAKFFTMDTARKKIDIDMIEILDRI